MKKVVYLKGMIVFLLYFISALEAKEIKVDNKTYLVDKCNKTQWCKLKEKEGSSNSIFYVKKFNLKKIYKKVKNIKKYIYIKNETLNKDIYTIEKIKEYLKKTDKNTNLNFKSGYFSLYNFNIIYPKEFTRNIVLNEILKKSKKIENKAIVKVDNKRIDILLDKEKVIIPKIINKKELVESNKINTSLEKKSSIVDLRKEEIIDLPNKKDEIDILLDKEELINPKIINEEESIDISLEKENITNSEVIKKNKKKDNKNQNISKEDSESNFFLFVGPRISKFDLNSEYNDNSKNLGDNSKNLGFKLGYYFNKNLFSTFTVEKNDLGFLDMTNLKTTLNYKFDNILNPYLGLVLGYSSLEWKESLIADSISNKHQQNTFLYGLNLGIEKEITKKVSLILNMEYSKIKHEVLINDKSLEYSSEQNYTTGIKYRF